MCYLFEFFILNNTAMFCLKLYTSLFSFQFYISYLKDSSYSWKRPNKIFCSNLAGSNHILLCANCCLTLLLLPSITFIQVFGVNSNRRFHHLESWWILKCLTPWTTSTLDIIHHLNIRKRKPYNILNILSIES